MSKRKRKERRRRRPATGKTPPADFLTVAWMLSVLTAFVCELVFVALRGYLFAVDGPATRVEVLAGVLVFAALVVGIISLLLGFVVVKVGRTRPPRGILVFAIVVGAAPAVTLLLRLVLSALSPSYA